MFSQLFKNRSVEWVTPVLKRNVFRSYQSLKSAAVYKYSVYSVNTSVICHRPGISSLTFQNQRFQSTSNGNLDRLKFEDICSNTLESLTDHFEELAESVPRLKSADVTYSDGVLTVQLGEHGTYVINRQTPNLQIWLSSPTSGPKRYDFVDGTWIYRHDNTTLHSLLDAELSQIAEKDVAFTNCSYSKRSV